MMVPHLVTVTVTGANVEEIEAAARERLGGYLHGAGPGGRVEVTAIRSRAYLVRGTGEVVSYQAEVDAVVVDDETREASR